MKPEIKRNKWGVRICEHNRLQYRCKECDGSLICEHNRRRNDCIECGGASICEHKRHRNRCKECRPLGWAKVKLKQMRQRSRKGGYKIPDITPERILLLSTKKNCLMCHLPFTLNNNPSCLHHNHETGEVYGFAHRDCNRMEGFFGKLTTAQQVRFLQTQFPDVVKALRK